MDTLNCVLFIALDKCYNHFAIAMNVCEPGQDRNVAALSINVHVRWFVNLWIETLNTCKKL